MKKFSWNNFWEKKAKEDFIKSTGKFGKSDSIDAVGLARYGYERQASLECYKPNQDKQQRLVKYTLRI